MKLIMIHGVGQSHTNAEALLERWSGALIAGGLNSDQLANAEPAMAFYGDILGSASNLIALEDLPSQYGVKADFLRDVGIELYSAIARMLTESVTTATSPPDRMQAETAMHRFVTGADAEAIRDVIEGMGEVYDYLKDRHLRDAIDAKVKLALSNQPQAIIGHSLGSVVAYRLLRDGGIACRRLITIGSPLAFKSVRALLDGPFSWPSGLTDWRNCYDRLDLICLGRPFQHSPAWAPRIKHAPVKNAESGNHAAVGYLRTPQMIETVATVL